MSKIIILLLIPQVVNNFNPLQNDGFLIIEPTSLRNYLEIKKNSENTKDLLKNLIKLDSEELNLLNIEKNFKKNIEKDDEVLIFLNYPRNKKQLEEVEGLINKYYEKNTFDNLIFANIEDYELINEIQKDYFTCPYCEKIHNKNEGYSEGQYFCLENNLIKFDDKFIEEFKNGILSQFLTENKKIIENFIEKKGNTNSIIKIELDSKEKIISQTREIIEIIKEKKNNN